MDKILEKCPDFSDCRHVGYKRPDGGSRVYAFRGDDGLSGTGELLILDALESLTFGEDNSPVVRKDTIVNVSPGELSLDFEHAISIEQDPENCQMMKESAT